MAGMAGAGQNVHAGGGQQARLLAREGVLSIFLDNPVRVVSSTEIRQMLRAGEPCGDLSPAVAEYIAAHGLYKGEDQ